MAYNRIYNRAARVQNLAIMVADGPSRFWGGQLSDEDLRRLFGALTSLSTLFLVVSWPSWPAGFDNSARDIHGFMLVTAHRTGQMDAAFRAEYTAALGPFLRRVRASAAELTGTRVRVSLVVDINHDVHYWPDDYRRRVNTF